MDYYNNINKWKQSVVCGHVLQFSICTAFIIVIVSILRNKWSFGGNATRYFPIRLENFERCTSSVHISRYLLIWIALTNDQNSPY